MLAAKVAGSHRIAAAERTDRQAAQLRDVGARQRGHAKVTSPGSDVRAGAAPQLQGEIRWLPVDQLRGRHGHFAQRKQRCLPAPREGVGPLTCDVNGGIGGRTLAQAPDHRRQDPPDRFQVRYRRLTDDGALGIEGVGLKAKTDGGKIALVESAQQPRQTGSASGNDAEQATGERVERTDVSDPARAEYALDPSEALEARAPFRFVQQHESVRGNAVRGARISR